MTMLCYFSVFSYVKKVVCMMKISSLTLIPMMFFGILLFSSPTFSQDHSDQTQITRSDYISMDKQVSILEFRVKELEKIVIKLMG